MFKDKRILITGGTGMVGRALIEILKTYGAKELVSVSMDDSTIDGVTCLKRDLRFLEEAMDICEDMDYIFHLAGIKGSPKMCAEKPYSFSVPMMQFNANMIEAFRMSNADAMLVTSSVGVYAPADIFYEDDVWKTFPSENDRFAGWAKRMLELNVEAYNKQYGGRPISIVRPANIYGRFDNFNPETAMVIPSLIARAFSDEKPLKVWGDGSVIRDFIHASDVARGMIHCVENGVVEPVNLGSGEGVTIKEIVQAIQTAVTTLTNNELEIEWDTTKPSGDAVRKMDTVRAKKYGFEATKNLYDGILDTVNWYLNNKELTSNRYDVFKT
jgi:GDP-L-fucose synthase